MPSLNRPNKVLSLITGQAVPGNAGVALMARIRGANGSLITQGSVSSISYSVWAILATVSGLAVPSQEKASTALTVSATIYDSLQQTDQLWTKDGPNDLGVDGSWGYNFRSILPASAFTVARSGDRYRADVILVPLSGEQFRMPFEWDSLRVYGS